MTQRTTNASPAYINIGSSANDGQGSSLREGAGFINNNFTDLYTAVNSIVDYTLPIATTSVVGGVKQGSNVSIASDGTISVSPPTSYTLPVASTSVLGGVKVDGATIGINNGIISLGIIFSGIIVMWSGAISAIPVGWVICDGTHGTPDLRNRFIVGAGTTYAVAATGGQTDSVLISHSHALSSTHATFTGNPLPTHNHTVTVSVEPPEAGTYIAGGGPNDNNDADEIAITLTTSAVSAGTPSGVLSGATETTGVSGTGSNLPPYYALAYIMKT